MNKKDISLTLIAFIVGCGIGWLLFIIINSISVEFWHKTLPTAASPLFGLTSALLTLWYTKTIAIKDADLKELNDKLQKKVDSNCYDLKVKELECAIDKKADVKDIDMLHSKLINLEKNQSEMHSTINEIYKFLITSK